ncbi:MAG: flagellin lysine-N-methylase [Magnetococcales bacterium]|nr:flagellin lysine-N-methylase [Magnetococcales bacterium]
MESRHLNYLSHFQCIGGACELSCCRGWPIKLLNDDLNRLRQSLGGSEAMRKRFERLVEMPQNPATGDQRKEGHDGEKACLKMIDGGCGFLDGAGLCTIQNDHGENALPSVCRQFPRNIARFRGRYEITASLACPEIARLCLLQEQPMAWTEGGIQNIPDTPTPANDQNPYQDHQPAIRDLFIQALNLTSYPLPSRLAILAYFAHRVDAFFNRDADTSFSLSRLEKEMTHIQQEKTRQTIHSASPLSKQPHPLTLRVIRSLLRGMVISEEQAGESAFMRELLGQAFTGYGVDPSNEVAMESLMGVYLERRLFWQDQFPEVLDRVFENYCKNQIFWRGPAEAPSLMVFLLDLVLFVGMLKFLLFGYLGSPRQISQAELEKAIERVFSRFFKVMGGKSTNLKTFQTFQHLMMFIAF